MKICKNNHHATKFKNMTHGKRETEKKIVYKQKPTTMQFKEQYMMVVLHAWHTSNSSQYECQIKYTHHSFDSYAIPIHILNVKCKTKKKANYYRWTNFNWKHSSLLLKSV